MRMTVIEQPGQKVSLERIPTCPPKHVDHEALEQRAAELEKELGLLQELLWGARQNSVLIVLQGRDTAGKDGTIKRVMGALNPRGVNVVSFGRPTDEEAEHDFLWRVHRHAPRLGEFAIFNRSHYEDVLVARVHHLVKKSQWRLRYAHICDFEQLLADQGCIVLKFFLHISKHEQHERLIDREKDPSKAWKLDPTDWKERELWKEYTGAYEDVFARCASPSAPWHIVPSDSKSYRNLVVAEAIVRALRPYKHAWVKALTVRGKLGRRALKALRARRD
jgi:PPK2 family polyphosphate:nucleotide phosphotransferase